MADPVRLKLARREFFAGGGFSGSYSPLSVKVQNLAFDKEVVVHYTPDGVTWKDRPLSFTTNYGDHDVFDATVNEQVAEFVIRYTAGGASFYDNNAGKNYQFTTNLAAVGGNVVLNTVTARRGSEAGGGFVFTTSWLEGEILVNNLSFAKSVGVRYSADGATWQDSPAAFAGSTTRAGVFVGSGAEVWRFKTPTLNLHPSPAFRLAVFYRDLSGGAQYWDNNFGQNYALGKADGATIE